MNYMLTEEEYHSLKEAANAPKPKFNKEELQEFCTEVANTMPVQSGWYKGKPWGCILTTDEEWYCDDCPTKKFCPYEHKGWSK